MKNQGNEVKNSLAKVEGLGKTTLVKSAHPDGPKPNGAGGCFTRWFNGFCTGQTTAEWLNSLGPDNAPYGNGSHNRTNFQVRQNWVKGNMHIVWESDPVYVSCPRCLGLGKAVAA